MKSFYIHTILLLVLVLAVSGCKDTDKLPEADETPPPSPASAAYSFVPSGLDGAGFQNVVAIRPGDPNYVLSGGDVAGIHLSTDGGATWKLSNKGLEANGARHVASLAFFDKDTVFSAVGGQNGYDGGLYKSTDAGASWMLFSDVTKFSGGNNRIPELAGKEHPRSTGNLIVIDSTKTYMYVGTFRDGVYRCRLSGNTPCVSVGMKGMYIRSLAIDPEQNDMLYASAYNRKDAEKSGVFKGTDVSSGSGEHFRRISEPAAADNAYYVEELKFVTPQAMYAVGADKEGMGIVFLVQNHGTEWSQKLTVEDTIFESVDGFVDPKTGKELLLVGTSDHPKDNHSVYRSTDGGESWGPVEAKPEKLVGGASWWYSPVNKGGLLGGNSYVSAQIAISDTPEHTVYMAGRAGLWKSTDQGATWVPAVRNMNATINHNIGVDPATGHVMVIDTDWKILVSTNRMADVTQNLHGMETRGVSGLSLAIDASSTPSTIYVGVGNRDDNKNGALYSTTDPLRGEWKSEKLDAAHGAEGYKDQRIIGLAAKTEGSNRYVLAAVEGKGLYLKKDDTWTHVNNQIALHPKDKNVPLVFDPSRPAAYAYDRESGVWRSTDNGRTWNLVYRAQTKEINRVETGYIALDAASDTLYISNDSGLYAMRNASNATDFAKPERIDLPANAAAGPLDVAGGKLYVAGIATNKGKPAEQPTADLFVYSPDEGLQSVGDDFYKANGGFPYDISIGKDGYIYVGMAGPGVLVGKPR